MPTKKTPINSPEDIYEIIHTGPTNYHLIAGDAKYWADGIDNQTALDAKMVIKAPSSPFIEESTCPEFIRDKVRDEFRRAGLVLRDESNPLTSMRVIVNDERARPFLEKIMRENNIPGEVIVKKETDIQ